MSPRKKPPIEEFRLTIHRSLTIEQHSRNISSIQSEKDSPDLSVCQQLRDELKRNECTFDLTPTER
jgi:hypothetical protein